MKTRQKILKNVHLNVKSPKGKIGKMRNGTPFVRIQKGSLRSPSLRHICENVTSTRKQIQFSENNESTSKRPKKVNFSAIKNKPCDLTEHLPKNYSTFVKPITNNEIANSTFQDLSVNKDYLLFEKDALSEAQQAEDLGAPEILRDVSCQNTSLLFPQLSTITEHPYEHIIPANLTNSPYDLNEINFSSTSSRNIGIQTETFPSELTPKKTRNSVKSLNPQGILRNNKLRKKNGSSFQEKKTHITIYAQEVYIENYIDKR